MQTFILAAGKQARFPDGHTPKQLLFYGEETVLARQIRQLHEHNLSPIVVTQNQAIKDACEKWHHPENNKTVLNTVASTFHLWTNDALFLLGDVFYSKKLFIDIINNDLETKFWCSGSEIFAFKTKNKNKIENAVNYCLENVRGDKKLWHLYRKLNDRPLKKHQIFNNEITGEIVADYTFDIDSLIQYEDTSRMLEILKETISDP